MDYCYYTVILTGSWNSHKLLKSNILLVLAVQQWQQPVTTLCHTAKTPWCDTNITNNGSSLLQEKAKSWKLLSSTELYFCCKSVDACDAAHVSLSCLPWTKLHTGFINLYCLVLHNSYYGQMMGRCNTWLTFGATLRSLSLAPSVTTLPSAHIHSEIQDATEKYEFRFGHCLNVPLSSTPKCTKSRSSMEFCCNYSPLTCFIQIDHCLLGCSLYICLFSSFTSAFEQCIHRRTKETLHRHGCW